MEIITLASSSAGNAYVLKNERTTIMLECGLPIKQIIRGLLKHKIVITSVSAVAVTHEHGDHALACQPISQYMQVIASKETLDKWKVRSRRWQIEEWQNAEIGTFVITPFKVDHDCEGAYGFIVYDKLNDERLLFINDTKFVRYDFSKYQFDYVMIECNHQDEILNLKDERTKRIANSHMSLRTTLLTLEKLDLSNTKAIYLMHMSDGNSDEQAMLETVATHTGKAVYSCQKEGGVREWQKVM